MAQLEEGVAVGNEVTMACVRRAVWGILYGDDEGTISRSAEGLAQMITIIVTVFEAEGLTVSERKTETMLTRKPGQTSLAPSLVIEAAGPIYRQANQFLYLRGVIHDSADLSFEAEGWIRFM